MFRSALFALAIPLFACAESVEPTLVKHPKTETVQPSITLSAPSDTIATDASGYVLVEGAELYYVQKGRGLNVVLLHGGLGNSDQWFYQFDALAKDFRVTAIDSRGHGRSTRDATPLGIHLMAEDIIAAMASLEIEKTSIIGWSDGGNIGLDMTLNHPDKIGKLIVLGSNYVVSGAKPDAGHNPLIGEYVSVMAEQYAKASKTEESFAAFSGEIFAMWGKEPNYSEDQLKSIMTPVLVMHGRHEEAIKLEHSESMARLLPHGELFIMEDVSHFGLWQNPASFNETVRGFLKQP